MSGPLRAQLGAELRILVRNGEQLLLTIIIPVLVLVFFGLTDVLPSDLDDHMDFLTPGVVALAIMSTSMVSLGIATGFERNYKVLKRLGVTPLGRPRWLAAKTLTVMVVGIGRALLDWRCSTSRVPPSMSSAITSIFSDTMIPRICASASRVERFGTVTALL